LDNIQTDKPVANLLATCNAKPQPTFGQLYRQLCQA